MNAWMYGGILVLGTFLSSVSQVMLKKSAMKTYASPLQEYLNPWVIGAYALFVLSTLMSVAAYRGLPLSMGPVLSAERGKRISDLKKIMILGAGIYQLPLIRRARARGLETLAVSPAGNYPGLAEADRVIDLDTRDREGILAAARRERICAIATTGTDVAMPALGAVCDALGLPGVSMEAALKATDKIRMKGAFRRGGVATTDFRAAASLEEALAAAEEIGYPVMVKIPDQSGSRGIARAADPETLREAWAYSRGATKAERILVEGFAEGTEFGVDAAVQGGRLRAVIPHEKRVYFSGRTGVPAGHLCPAAFPPAFLRKIREETERIVRALGLDNCAVNIDAMRTPGDGICVIEAAARCGGTGIPEVLSGYLGVNWYDVILDLALGREVNLPREEGAAPRAALSRMIISDREGTLTSLSYTAEGHPVSNGEYRGEGIQVTLNVAPGDPVRGFENGTERLGQAVFYGKSRQEILAAEADFLRSLRVETKA